MGIFFEGIINSLSALSVAHDFEFSNWPCTSFQQVEMVCAQDNEDDDDDDDNNVYL